MSSYKLLVFFFFFLFNINLYAQPLTITEQQWIKENPVITVQSEQDWEPFNYNQNGKPAGHSIDYMKLLASKLGLELRFIQGHTWKEYMEMLKQNKLDLIVNIAKTPQREQFYSYTKEYHKVLSSLYVRKEDMGKYTSLKDLEGKTVSVVQGMVGESVLRNNYPKINIYPVKNSLDALKAVIYGNADGVVQINTLGNRLIKKHNFVNLQPIFEITDSKFNMHLHLATQKNNTTLRDILQKGMSQITTKELNELKQKHFNSKQQFNSNLTLKELEWIRDNPKVKIGLQSFQEPLVISKKEKIEGIVPEYLELLSQKLNLDLDIHLIASKKEIKQKLLQTDIDATLTSNNLYEQQDIKLLRSDQFLDFPMVIASLEKNPLYNGLNDTSLKRLAIAQLSPIIAKIQEQYPEIKIIEVAGCKDGLNALLENRADAYMCSPDVIAHTLRNLNIDGIVISSITPYKVGFTFQVEKENPTLHSILNNAINQVSSYEVQEIKKRWQHLELQKLPDYTRHFQIVAIVFILILIIIVWITWWNRRLSYEVEQKEIAQKNALENEQRIHTLLDTIPDMVWMKDNNGKYLACNLMYQKFLNLQEKEILGKTDYDFYDKERADFYRKNDQLAVDAGKPRSNEEDAIYFDGKTVMLQTIKAPVFDANGNNIGVLGIGRDITDLKNQEKMLISQSRHAAMGEMIGMIAHQWRQPLSVISMYANNILADIELDDLKEESLREVSMDILSHTKELSKTIDDFRNFFKPDKELERSNVEDILNKTIHIVNDSLKNNEIQFNVTIESDANVLIYPRELMQVFVNVITNAKDALVQNEIENKKIDVKVFEDEKYINIAICDNAKGIDKDILPRIFEPYFTTKNESSGTGLGLYMSKVIIEEHLKGKLEVCNTNDGACFTIELLKDEIK